MLEKRCPKCKRQNIGRKIIGADMETYCKDCGFYERSDYFLVEVEDTVWQSPEKNKNNQPFLTVKKEGNYYYSERAGRDSLAFILYSSCDDTVCLINEKKPPLGNTIFRTTAFGGSLDDPTLTVEEICIKEVKEEAGYTVTYKELHDIGQVMVSTQSNQYCHLYLVDVSSVPQGERDLQEGEEDSTLVWMKLDEAVLLEDWKASTIIAKAILKEII